MSTYLRKAILRPTAGGQREVSQDQIQRCEKEVKEWRQRRRGIITPTSNHYNLVETIRALKKQIAKAAGRNRKRNRRNFQPQQDLFALGLTYETVQKPPKTHQAKPKSRNKPQEQEHSHSRAPQVPIERPSNCTSTATAGRHSCQQGSTQIRASKHICERTSIQNAPFLAYHSPLLAYYRPPLSIPQQNGNSQKRTNNNTPKQI